MRPDPAGDPAFRFRGKCLVKGLAPRGIRPLTLTLSEASLTPTLSLAEGEGDRIPLASPLVEVCLAGCRTLEAVELLVTNAEPVGVGGVGEGTVNLELPPDALNGGAAIA